MNTRKLSILGLLTLGVSTAFMPQAQSATTPITVDQANAIAAIDSGRVRLINIMSNAETGVTAHNKRLLQHAEAQNLGTDLNITEIAKFFGCKTVVGETFLIETLQSPVSPRERDSVLVARQNMIRSLVENPELKQAVETLLEQARLEEQAVITLLSEQFKGKTCPELPQLEITKKQNPRLYPIHNALVKNSVGRTIKAGYFLGIIGFAAYVLKNNLIPETYQALTLPAETKAALIVAGSYYPFLALNLLSTLYMSSITSYLSYLSYQDYAAASEKRSQLHALNQLIAIVETSEKLCAQYGIKKQFNLRTIKNPEALGLIKELKSSRYQAKKSWIFMYPLTHSFLYKVYQNEQHLSELFACIAELDAYNAIATKIIESQSQKNKFCFVNYVDQAKPFVNAHNFWNVLVKDAVPSSLTESRHLILTGPNAGGKTTTIRALLQNIVLGQSYGIAAAESFSFTMFDIIHSYLNVSDDLLNGRSLFVSEVKRAQDILEVIKTLDPQKKYFFALDELFTGTVAEDGEKCAYEFVKRISEFNGVQFIYATHFSKLKELGNNSPLCANYKVDAPVKNAVGKLVYPFTLSQGANHNNIALDIAREANLFA